MAEQTEAGRRTVTLPAAAAVALAEHLAEYAEPGPDGLVFPAPEGGYLRRSNFNRRSWRSATQASGVERLRFHDLRHSAATLALAAGANTRELMERMGHTSPAVALPLANRAKAIKAAFRLDQLSLRGFGLGSNAPTRTYVNGSSPDICAEPMATQIDRRG